MDEQQTNSLDTPTDSQSEGELLEWVTPTLEEFSLKDALAGFTVVSASDLTNLTS